ncbi:MAG: hypothetical protein H0W86_02415, partial [Armatimonadetes bacterium]|nr:hypothetical protein [Armatimonadota bacterium]
LRAEAIYNLDEAVVGNKGPVIRRLGDSDSRVRHQAILWLEKFAHKHRMDPLPPRPRWGTGNIAENEPEIRDFWDGRVADLADSVHILGACGRKPRTEDAIRLTELSNFL